MKTIICPKCKQVITITTGTEFVICCDEVIYTITNETHDRKDEESLGDS